MSARVLYFPSDEWERRARAQEVIAQIRRRDADGAVAEVQAQRSRSPLACSLLDEASRQLDSPRNATHQRGLLEMIVIRLGAIVDSGRDIDEAAARRVAAHLEMR